MKVTPFEGILASFAHGGISFLVSTHFNRSAFYLQHSHPEPWMQADFIDKIIRLQKHRQIETVTSPDELQVYDRSPICTFALSQYLGYPPSPCLLAEMERIERENIYQRQVFFLENLGFCQLTEARKISFEESLLFENIHAEIYTSLGYDLIKIAPEALSERVHRIMNLLADFPCFIQKQASC